MAEVSVDKKAVVLKLTGQNGDADWVERLTADEAAKLGNLLQQAAKTIKRGKFKTATV